MLYLVMGIVIREGVKNIRRGRGENRSCLLFLGGVESNFGISRGVGSKLSLYI